MLYGAYGANLNMANMEVRCPQAKPILGFNLEGYRLVFNGVADMIKDNNKSLMTIGKIPIGLWKITKECEKSLDRYEGYPASYFNTIAQGYDDFALDKDYLNWAVHEADQMQKNKLDVFRKVGS